MSVCLLNGHPSAKGFQNSSPRYGMHLLPIRLPNICWLCSMFSNKQRRLKALTSILLYGAPFISSSEHFKCIIVIVSKVLKVNLSQSHPSVGQDCASHSNTLSYEIPFTAPPPIAVRAFRLNPSRLVLRSSAASLFRGSEAFGSRKRNFADC